MFLLLTLTIIIAGFAGCSDKVGANQRSETAGPPLAAAAAPTPSPTPDPGIVDSVKIACGQQEFLLQNYIQPKSGNTEIRLIRGENTTLFLLQAPTDDFQNFAVGFIGAQRNGFEINVDWGTRISHEIGLYFVCQRGEFLLTRIRHQTFDKRDPENDKKYTNRIIRLRPNIPFKDVVIADLAWTLYEKPNWSGKVAEMIKVSKG